MKTSNRLALLFSILVLIFSFTACGGNNEEEEKSSIEKFTDKTAHKAVDQINAPIDKAKAVRELVDQQTKKTEKTTEQIDQRKNYLSLIRKKVVFLYTHENSTLYFLCFNHILLKYLNHQWFEIDIGGLKKNNHLDKAL